MIRRKVRPIISTDCTPPIHRASRGNPAGESKFAGGQHVILDPATWWTEQLPKSPRVVVAGPTGSGKTWLAKEWIRNAVEHQVTPMILGDAWGDYAALVDDAGGQVIRLGARHDTLNPLDLIGLSRVAANGEQARRHEMNVTRRRRGILTTLITVVRGTAPTITEDAQLCAALTLAVDTARNGAAPLISDVIDALRSGGPRVGAGVTETALLRSLTQLTDGFLGPVLNQPTSTPIDPTAPALCLDLSGLIGDGEMFLAAMVTCWAHGYAAIDAAHAHNEAAGRQHQTWLAVLDGVEHAARLDRAPLLDWLRELGCGGEQNGAAQVAIIGPMNCGHPTAASYTAVRQLIDSGDALVCSADRAATAATAGGNDWGDDGPYRRHFTPDERVQLVGLSAERQHRSTHTDPHDFLVKSGDHPARRIRH